MASEPSFGSVETGTCPPGAIAVHRRYRCRPIDCVGAYAGNPFSVCHGKALSAAAHA